MGGWLRFGLVCLCVWGGGELGYGDEDGNVEVFSKWDLGARWRKDGRYDKNAHKKYEYVDCLSAKRTINSQIE